MKTKGLMGLMQFDARLCGKVMDETARSRGEDFARKGAGQFTGGAAFPDEEVLENPSLVINWLLFHWNRGRPNRRCLAEHALQENGAAYSSRERALLQAKLQAWLAPWRVEAVRGSSFTLHDRLTLQTRTVSAPGADLHVGHHLLARVLDFEGHSLIEAAHHYASNQTPLLETLLEQFRELWKVEPERPMSIALLQRNRCALELLGYWRIAVLIHAKHNLGTTPLREREKAMHSASPSGPMN